LCGIIGIWAKNNQGKKDLSKIELALPYILHRGPDHQQCKMYSNCALGHTRLSIIDPDERANQPFSLGNGRYTLVFNGEIYNYIELRKSLEIEGVKFETNSDTEVLYHLLIREGELALEKLNGFFAFGFYDERENTLLLARDRMGIKPLLIYEDTEKFIFSSTLDSLFEFDIPKEINFKALNNYFQYTYISAPQTILENTKKLEPGYYCKVTEKKITYKQYYLLNNNLKKQSYSSSKNELKQRLHQSVESRLIADVPIGCFLSGGVDSSIIAAIAKSKREKLNTFSVGFDHAYFNESAYAEMVANHIGSKHETFMLTKRDFQQNFNSFLDIIDEPFADSSAFAVYLLAKKTKGYVDVALSGDGADELFAGYRKHYAEWKITTLNKGSKYGISALSRLLKSVKINRSDRLGDFNRKLQKLNEGLNKNADQRYLDWCSFIPENARKNALIKSLNNEYLCSDLENIKGVNDVLLNDQKFVLPNDMLKKVDLMSMASALEVRTPFLDHHFVEFVNTLPSEYKLGKKGGKLILKETFFDDLPPAIFKRAKKGFEIPIHSWLQDELDEQFNRPIFSRSYLEEQNLFNPNEIYQLISDWRKNDFGDKIYIVWALIIFQHWWDKHFYII